MEELDDLLKDFLPPPKPAAAAPAPAGAAVVGGSDGIAEAAAAAAAGKAGTAPAAPAPAPSPPVPRVLAADPAAYYAVEGDLLDDDDLLGFLPPLPRPAAAGAGMSRGGGLGLSQSAQMGCHSPVAAGSQLLRFDALESLGEGVGAGASAMPAWRPAPAPPMPTLPPSSSQMAAATATQGYGAATASTSYGSSSASYNAGALVPVAAPPRPSGVVTAPLPPPPAAPAITLDAVLPPAYRHVIPHATLNAVQSVAFEALYNSDANVVVAAPTGCGKTTLFELAMLRLLLGEGGSGSSSCGSGSNGGRGKILYLGPLRSLCQERYADWVTKLTGGGGGGGSGGNGRGGSRAAATASFFGLPAASLPPSEAGPDLRIVCFTGDSGGGGSGGNGRGGVKAAGGNAARGGRRGGRGGARAGTAAAPFVSASGLYGAREGAGGDGDGDDDEEEGGGAYAGEADPVGTATASIGDLLGADLIIATPEKLDAVTRRWRDNVGLLGQVSLVCLDEVHLLGEAGRGATLEAVVTRLKAISAFAQQAGLSWPASRLRFVAASATLPNLGDVGAWLGATPATVFNFGPEYRPVPLSIHYLGYEDVRSGNGSYRGGGAAAGSFAALRRNGEGNDDEEGTVAAAASAVSASAGLTAPVPPIDTLATYGGNPFLFERTLDARVFQVVTSFSSGRPALVFCTSRRSVKSTADALVSAAVAALPGGGGAGAGPASFFVRDSAHASVLAGAASSAREPRLAACLRAGVGFHSAGEAASDRALVERLFLAGELPVLCTTTTLALGVNLPAHLVVIKGTAVWRGAGEGGAGGEGGGGGYVEYPKSQLLQMIGRAGRPQFDANAVAVVMGPASASRRYADLTAGGSLDAVESVLLPRLAEHLLAEVCLGTVRSLGEALTWIKGTFLAVRAGAAPAAYGLPPAATREALEGALLRLLATKLWGAAAAGCVQLFLRPANYHARRAGGRGSGGQGGYGETEDPSTAVSSVPRRVKWDPASPADIYARATGSSSGSSEEGGDGAGLTVELVPTSSARVLSRHYLAFSTIQAFVATLTTAGGEGATAAGAATGGSAAAPARGAKAGKAGGAPAAPAPDAGGAEAVTRAFPHPVALLRALCETTEVTSGLVLRRDEKRPLREALKRLETTRAAAIGAAVTAGTAAAVAAAPATSSGGAVAARPRARSIPGSSGFDPVLAALKGNKVMTVGEKAFGLLCLALGRAAPDAAASSGSGGEGGSSFSLKMEQNFVVSTVTRLVKAYVGWAAGADVRHSGAVLGGLLAARVLARDAWVEEPTPLRALLQLPGITEAHLPLLASLGATDQAAVASLAASGALAPAALAGTLRKPLTWALSFLAAATALPAPGSLALKLKQTDTLVMSTGWTQPPHCTAGSSGGGGSDDEEDEDNNAGGTGTGRGASKSRRSSSTTSSHSRGGRRSGGQAGTDLGALLTAVVRTAAEGDDRGKEGSDAVASGGSSSSAGTPVAVVQVSLAAASAVSRPAPPAAFAAASGGGKPAGAPIRDAFAAWRSLGASSSSAAAGTSSNNPTAPSAARSSGDRYTLLASLVPVPPAGSALPPSAAKKTLVQTISGVAVPATVTLRVPQPTTLTSSSSSPSSAPSWALEVVAVHEAYHGADTRAVLRPFWAMGALSRSDGSHAAAAALLAGSSHSSATGGAAAASGDDDDDDSLSLGSLTSDEEGGGGGGGRTAGTVAGGTGSDDSDVAAILAGLADNEAAPTPAAARGTAAAAAAAGPPGAPAPSAAAAAARRRAAGSAAMLTAALAAASSSSVAPTSAFVPPTGGLAGTKRGRPVTPPSLAAPSTAAASGNTASQAGGSAWRRPRLDPAPAPAASAPLDGSDEEAAAPLSAPAPALTIDQQFEDEVAAAAAAALSAAAAQEAMEEEEAGKEAAAPSASAPADTATSGGATDGGGGFVWRSRYTKAAPAQPAATTTTTTTGVAATPTAPSAPASGVTWAAGVAAAVPAPPPPAPAPQQYQPLYQLTFPAQITGGGYEAAMSTDTGAAAATAPPGVPLPADWHLRYRYKPLGAQQAHELQSQQSQRHQPPPVAVASTGIGAEALAMLGSLSGGLRRLKARSPGPAQQLLPGPEPPVAVTVAAPLPPWSAATGTYRDDSGAAEQDENAAPAYHAPSPLLPGLPPAAYLAGHHHHYHQQAAAAAAYGGPYGYYAPSPPPPPQQQYYRGNALGEGGAAGFWAPRSVPAAPFLFGGGSALPPASTFYGHFAPPPPPHAAHGYGSRPLFPALPLGSGSGSSSRFGLQPQQPPPSSFPPRPW